MSDENNFQNLYAFDDNNSIPSSKNDGENTDLTTYDWSECTRIKPYNFEACISDSESSNKKDNL